MDVLEIDQSNSLVSLEFQVSVLETDYLNDFWQLIYLVQSTKSNCRWKLYQCCSKFCE